MGKQAWRKRQVLESDEDRPGAGAGGVLSQLRKCLLLRLETVVPPDEPENAMAPAKKKGTQRAKVPQQNTIMGIPTPVATGLPVLHMTDNGSLVPVLVLVVLVVVLVAVVLVVVLAGLFVVLFARLLVLPFEVLLEVLLVASLMTSFTVIFSLTWQGFPMSNIMLASNQCSKPSIITPHAPPDIASSASCLFAGDGSDGADGEINEDGMGVDEGVDEDEDGMGVGEDGMDDDEDGMGVDEDGIGLDEDNIGFKEEDIGIEEDGVGIEEDNIGVEEDDTGVEENGDNNMDYVDYGNEDIMYASDHIADPGAEDEDEDNTAAAHMDGNQQNHVQHHPGQAEKRTNHTRNVDKDRHQHSTIKAARSNAPAIPDTDYDLLQLHHAKNHRPHSLSPTYLNNIQSQHLKSKRACTGHSPDDQHEDSEDDIDTGRKHHNAKKKGDVANPTTLGFFPHLWGKLLDYAKANFRLYLAISDPFPNKEEALSSYKREMAIVVYNDAATFRSRIKQIALAIVPLEYRLALLQGTTIADVKTLNIQLLTTQQGRTSNFANNALQTICHKVYYDSGSKSLRQFPAFQKTIPSNALILIATIVSMPIPVI
ncbi:hypothetical protein EV702DRAFT_1051114 [Suillus placidus]|uniref:DUF6532 domain-containing protein n=1 Tax=Suillus placidus TaxID=48579 RepID=A0A9P7CVV8_9AGAM|nr:hypothetical protein EV702DRAFT_1051114 [Suillus placidus]